MAKRALSDWQVDHFRVVCFGPSTPADVWERTHPAAPAEIDSRDARIGKRERGVAKDNNWLAVVSLPGRTDLVLGTAPQNPQRAMDGIGSYVERLEDVKGLARAFVGAFTESPVVRIAFAGVFRLPVADHATGYQQLSDYLPAVQIDAANSFDFLYRINRPRSATLSDKSTLRINRLSQWSVAKQVEATFNVGPAGLIHIPGGAERFSCQLMVDINTDGERVDRIPIEELGPLLESLIACATEITEQGDVK